MEASCLAGLGAPDVPVDRRFCHYAAEGVFTETLALVCLTARTFDRWAPYHDLLLRPLDRLFLDRWRTRLWSELPGRRILEVGVGTGASFCWYPEAAEIQAIDVSAGMLDVASRRRMPSKSKVELRLMDVQKLRYPDDTFDAVVGSFVFCSVPAPIAGLRELHRVCRPGGTLRLLEHVRSGGRLGRLMDLLNGPLARHYGENINRRTSCTVAAVGWEVRRLENLLLDIVQLIEAVKD